MIKGQSGVPSRGKRGASRGAVRASSSSSPTEPPPWAFTSVSLVGDDEGESFELAAHVPDAPESVPGSLQSSVVHSVIQLYEDPAAQYAFPPSALQIMHPACATVVSDADVSA